MERFTTSLLAENLHLVLPRSWKGEKFVCWQGGQSRANSGNNNGGNDVPRAGWLALFWTEISLLDIHSTPGLEQWPLLPITTGELVSCSMLQQARKILGGVLSLYRDLSLSCVGICSRNDIKRHVGYGAMWPHGEISPEARY